MSTPQSARACGVDKLKLLGPSDAAAIGRAYENAEEYRKYDRRVQEMRGKGQRALADRIICALESHRGLFGVTPQVDLLEHELQTATRAKRGNASDEYVLASLCHDITAGVVLRNHAGSSGEIVKPYVSQEAYDAVRFHSVLFRVSRVEKGVLPATILDTAEYAELRARPYFDRLRTWSGEFHEPAFDTNYKSLPLAEFEPLIRQFFDDTAFYQKLLDKHEIDSADTDM